MGMFDILGGNRNASRGGMSPIGLAVLGTIAYQALKHKGQLADMLGGKQDEASPSRTGLNSSAAAAGSGGLFGALGGGGGLASGFQDLLDRFRQSGHEDKAQSWVSTGANRPIAPDEMEQVLGPDRLQWLMQQTGLSKEQLLAGLSKELPNAIDKMTPNGQVPSDDEFTQQLRH